MFLQESAIELHDTLNPKLWDENDNLRPLVKDRLIKIVDKYIESSNVITKDDVIDVELLGSNASYNYTPYSDLDIHLVVNMEDVSCDPALFQLACNAERSNFNKNYDFKIKGIDVELYVEDVHAGTASNGIYSLYKDEWIKFPSKITVPDYDNDEEYIKLLDSWKSLAETTLANATSASEVQDYVNNLYNLRRTSIMTDGEFGKGNLVFKEIRNEGLLDELKQKQYELSSKELSLESVGGKSMLTFNTPYTEEEINARLVKIDHDRLSNKGVEAMRKDAIRNFDLAKSISEEVEEMKKTRAKKESIRKYRVNYMLNESFHYSIVEAENEDAADEIVFDALGEPESYDLLGVEEDKVHLLEPGNDSAMAEIINKLIIDEWEAISGYNSASVTAQQMGLEDAASLLADLSKEETEHVGELQELLKSFDKNTHAIVDGEEEAKDKLDESLEDLDEVDYAKLVTIVDKKYRTNVDKFVDDVMQGKHDRDIEYTVSEPNNSIEFAEKDMSNNTGKVIYRYFIDIDNGELLVYVNVK